MANLRLVLHRPPASVHHRLSTTVELLIVDQPPLGAVSLDIASGAADAGVICCTGNEGR